MTTQTCCKHTNTSVAVCTTPLDLHQANVEAASDGATNSVRTSIHRLALPLNCSAALVAILLLLLCGVCLLGTAMLILWYAFNSQYVW